MATWIIIGLLFVIIIVIVRIHHIIALIEERIKYAKDGLDSMEERSKSVSRRLQDIDDKCSGANQKLHDISQMMKHKLL